MNLQNIDLKTTVKKVVFQGQEVLVKQYISAKAKQEIIDGIKTEVLNEIIIDQVKLDVLFNMYIIVNYTDIEFPDKEYETLLKYYDYLESTDYLNGILGAIPKVEYDTLRGYLDLTLADFDKYKVSFAGTMESLVVSLPALMENIGAMSKELKGLEMAQAVYNKLQH